MWILKDRPGYFGRRKAEKIAQLNEKYGIGNWTLGWVVRKLNDVSDPIILEFEDACKRVYEQSYFEYLLAHPGEFSFICSFFEVIDNAPSNIQSGLDYTIQEASSTHIQDIAIRNVLKKMGLWFKSVDPDNILVVRGEDSNGFRFNPGQIPLATKFVIEHPSIAPKWAKPGSVEDFWQSNKHICVRE